MMLKWMRWVRWCGYPEYIFRCSYDTYVLSMYTTIFMTCIGEECTLQKSFWQFKYFYNLILVNYFFLQDCLPLNCINNDEAYGFEYYYLVWTRLLGWTKLKCQIHWPEAVSIDLYIYNLHKPHKVCIILTSTSTSSLCWLGRQSVFCRYPPFRVIGHLQRSKCDLRLRTFLPLIHQCEFSTSFLSLKIKLEFCYKHY
jgi:hypothetical protein